MDTEGRITDVHVRISELLSQAEAFSCAEDFGGALARARYAADELARAAREARIDETARAELGGRVALRLRRYRAALDAWQEQARGRYRHYLDRELGRLPSSDWPGRRMPYHDGPDLAAGARAAWRAIQSPLQSR